MEAYSTRWPVGKIGRLSRGISSQQWSCTEQEREENLKQHVSYQGTARGEGYFGANETTSQK